MNFFMILIPPSSFICNQYNYRYQASMEVYPYTHRPCNLEKIRMWKKKNVEVGIGHIFVVLGGRVRVLIPINGCQVNATSA